MTDDEALETLFAMANVQDGYAKKATDPGLKVIHKANAKAQREVVATIKDLRARLASAEADLVAMTARVVELEGAAGNAAMYLNSGFINCPRCGEEVPTKDTDAEYEIRAALQHKDAKNG